MNVFCIYDSPLGPMTLQATEDVLLGAWFTTQTTLPAVLGKEQPYHPILLQTQQQLSEYFRADRKEFSIPLAAQGTAFQQQVWQALTNIAYGHRCSYQTLAEAINNPKAVRAVGMANGKNPISIIVPCHRVIGKNGKLTGYAGGMERKQWLLNLESANA